MLPVAGVAMRMRRLIAEHDIDTVWFGAAAPLALLAPRARRGRRASGAGEYPWPRGGLVDAARGALGAAPHRRSTATSSPSSATTRATASPRRSDREPAWSACHPASTPSVSSPIRPAAPTCVRALASVSGRRCVCLSRLVPRKGQDMLIRALPAIRQRVRRRRAGDRRRRPVPGHAARAGRALRGHRLRRRSPAACRSTSCPRTTRWPTCSPCRAGPAGPASTSKGSASSTWRRRPRGVPVVAGSSGGAPESVVDGETGHGGRRCESPRSALPSATCSPTRSVPLRWAQPAAIG